MNCSAEPRAEAGTHEPEPDPAGPARTRGAELHAAAEPPREAPASILRAWPLVAVTGLFLLFALETVLVAALVSGTAEVATTLPVSGSAQGVAAAALAVLLFGGVLAVAAVRRLVQVSDADRRARSEAEAALRARDEFLGLTAHELKTPLTALFLELGAARREAERSGDESARRFLGRADRAAHRLGDLVSRLLTEARGTGEALLAREAPLAGDPRSAEASPAEEIELGDLARHAVDARRELFQRARCEVSVQAEAPVTGRWDRCRLERALASLLSNAAKYGHGQPIEVLVTRDGAGARLSVRDHGIGIAPEQRGSIFDRYQRAVSPRNYGGLGLGLWITRCETTALGGSVSVDSRPGEGSVFTIRLPPSARGPAARPDRRLARTERARRALRWLASRRRGC